VPGALGDLRRRYSGVQPQRHGRMPQVVGSSGQRGGHLLRCQRAGKGIGPHVAERGGGDDLAAFTAEQPPVGRDPEGLDVAAQDGDQLGRDRDLPGVFGGPVLEPAFLVHGSAVAPAAGDLGP